MLHGSTTISLGEGKYLQVGYVMCFGNPTVNLLVVSTHPGAKTEVVGGVSFDPSHVESVIDALKKLPSLNVGS